MNHVNLASLFVYFCWLYNSGGFSSAIKPHMHSHLFLVFNNGWITFSIALRHFREDYSLILIH